MKRKAITRGQVWRKKRPIVRPPAPACLPSGWRTLCAAIRRRDNGRCRRCGTLPAGWAIDHIIPRRLLNGRETAIKSNLALLCPECHAYKTMDLEPRLYAADVSAFEAYLGLIGGSGPVPSKSLKAKAYQRLRRSGLYG